ncbi:restriction endonuclease [Thaumasiovibrio sp. DFM-14]|uniref:restriction endonuclease n=1 Tax=Thaumasiovibrio sp. DFM-14 TaxID=3384792 RepID=UPI0039A0A772
MTNYRQHVWQEMLSQPWYIYPIIASVTYVTMKLTPYILHGTPGLHLIAISASKLGGILAVLFLLPTPFIFYQQRHSPSQVSRVEPDHLHNLTPEQLRAMVMRFYRQQRFMIIDNHNDEEESGIDIWLTKGGERILLDCHYLHEKSVTIEMVNHVYRCLQAHHAKRAIIITTGRYETNAVKFVQDKAISLIGGGKLSKMLATITPNEEENSPQ